MGGRLIFPPRARVPDFFIVGAPKCGTNALYTYLNGHPGIYMPRLKEPQFLCHDLPELSQVRDADAYHRLFDAAPADVLVGEASVWYLFSGVAIREILRLNPHAKVIVLLRNPVDLAYSLHSQFLRGFKEFADFETAWNLQNTRRRGRYLPRYCPEPRCLQYRDVCSFAHQIWRAKSLVPPGQLKVYIYEDMFADMRRYYQGVLQFLRLPDDGRIDFPAINENAMLRSAVIGQVAANMPWPVAKRYSAMRSALLRFGIRPRRWLAPHIAVKAQRPPLRAEFRQMLMDEFADDVRRLEKLLARDLTVWRSGPSMHKGGTDCSIAPTDRPASGHT
jgi:Sulfotransferase domain